VIILHLLLLFFLETVSSINLTGSKPIQSNYLNDHFELYTPVFHLGFIEQSIWNYICIKNPNIIIFPWHCRIFSIEWWICSSLEMFVMWPSKRNCCKAKMTTIKAWSFNIGSYEKMKKYFFLINQKVDWTNSTIIIIGCIFTKFEFESKMAAIREKI
jgi:hypothetical protein